MKNYLIIGGLLFFSLGYSQTDIDFRGDRLMENMWFKTIGKENLADIEGSPYYTKEFITSKISDYPDQIMTRYDMYNDNIEFLKDGKTFILPKTENYKTINLLSYGKKIQLIEGNYYFSVFEGKNYSIYKKIKTKFQPFERAKNGYTEDKEAKFYNLPDSFFILNNNKLLSLPQNKNNFAKLFPNIEKEVIQEIKKNKINLNNENDLKTIMQYIDSK
jgi:hypothetical protein